MVSSCGVVERRLVLMLMDFAMLVKLCGSHALVRMWEWHELKLNTGRWYLVPACSTYLHSLPLRMYSFLPFDLCGVDTKPQSHGSFYKGNPVWVSVSGSFPDNDIFQWTRVINSKRGEKKDWLSWVYWSPYLQQFWNLLANHWSSINVFIEPIFNILDCFDSLWNLSLCCDLSHLGKRVPCYWWHKCSGTVKPKCNLDFFGFWQSLLPWGGQLNFFFKYFNSQQNSSWEYTGGSRTPSNRESFGCLAVYGKLWTGFDQNIWNHNLHDSSN